MINEKYKGIIIILLLLLFLFGCTITTGSPQETIIVDPIKISYNTQPKINTYEYYLKNERNTIYFELFGGLNDYFKLLDRNIYYTYKEPSLIDFINKKINNEIQQENLSLSINKIKNMNISNDDKARIIISLVQNIPYDDWAADTNTVTGKYPYEVLYTETGVCGEKSQLIVLFLKEFGFGTALFNFEIENHQAAGIKCPIEYSYKNSGYCFIEATTPNIITDSYGDYVGAGKLISIPEISIMSDGYEFNPIEEISILNYYNDIDKNKIELGIKIDELKIKLDEINNELSYISDTTLYNQRIDEYNTYNDERNKYIDEQTTLIDKYNSYLDNNYWAFYNQ